MRISRSTRPDRNKDGKEIEGDITGACPFHTLHTMLDEPSFKVATGLTKNEHKAKYGSCDIEERRMDADEDPDEFLSRNVKAKNSYPNGEVIVTEIGTDNAGYCVNHAQIGRRISQRTMFDLGNIRGDKLNPGESNEAEWHFKQRANKIAERANDAWNHESRERAVSLIEPFNSGTPERTKDKAISSEDDVEILRNNEPQPEVPQSMKDYVKTQTPFWKR